MSTEEKKDATKLFSKPLSHEVRGAVMEVRGAVMNQTQERLVTFEPVVLQTFALNFWK